MHARFGRATLISSTILILLGSAAGSGGDAPEAADPSPRARAIELYDLGAYAEACPLLQRLDTAGETDGALLYRIHYCQRIARDPQAATTLESARRALESEAPKSPDLEAPFYLANAYATAGRQADARRAAGVAIRRIESGSLPRPTTALDMFRLGKLYADYGNRERASAWYLDALRGFEASATNAPAYTQWASRYLAEGAFAADDFAEAERHYSTLATADALSTAELDRLAIARARLGLYNEAAQAWQQVVRRDPANADRARYSAALCGQAAALPDLPVLAPDGRLWSEWGGPELESTMRGASVAAGEIKAEAAPFARRDPQRAKLRQRLREQRLLFVGAGLEYTLQGHNLREAAFAAGYATLVFRESDWKLPRPTPTPTPDPGTQP